MFWKLTLSCPCVPVHGENANLPDTPALFSCPAHTAGTGAWPLLLQLLRTRFSADVSCSSLEDYCFWGVPDFLISAFKNHNLYIENIVFSIYS